MAVINQLQRNDEEMKDNRLVKKILHSLDPKFDYIAVAIEESNNLDTMSADELIGSLQDHEPSINKNKKETIKVVLHKKLTLKEEKSSNSGGY